MFKACLAGVVLVVLAQPVAADPKGGGSERGLASWYGRGHHGRPTASGEPFDSRALTAAHKSLPFGSRIRVTSERSGKSVIVRINDRGPFGRGRVLDLSYRAAQSIGITGVAPVSIARM